MNEATSRFIAIDWGTTNRRIYLLGADAELIATECDDRGVMAMNGHCFDAEVAKLRARFGDHPVICAGMVGSPRGWANVPYVACPAGFEEVAAGLHWVEPGRAAIVPGVSSVAGRKGDTMRGEEVQLLGAVIAGLAPGDGVLCQPGTHCKWALMEDGRIRSFRTTMTGELYALLRKHSLLSDVIEGEVEIGPAFHEGLADAKSQYLLNDLFRIRASGMLGLRSKEEAASYASGLLIGSDVREQDLSPDKEVFILADPTFGGLYREALRVAGVSSTVVDSHASFVAGIARIWELANVR